MLKDKLPQIGESIDIQLSNGCIEKECMLIPNIGYIADGISPALVISNKLGNTFDMALKWKPIKAK